jgi:hypothetical protein
MLILDFSKDSSLYFTDYADAVDDIKVESTQDFFTKEELIDNTKGLVN